MQLIRRYPVRAYFIFAFVFSWGVASMMVARHEGLVDVPGAIHYLIAWGPALSAVLVTAITSGRAGLNDLVRRILHWRIGSTEWLLAAGTPLIFLAIAIVVSRILTGVMPNLELLGYVDYLGNIGIFAAIVVWILSFGIGEEIGWRGFAQHHMQPQSGMLQTAVIIGVIWAAWHVPYFFYKDTFIEMGIAGFPFYALNMVMGSILLAWLYNRTSSILAIGIWHGLFDFATAASIDDGIVTVTIGGLVVAWVISIIRRDRRAAASNRLATAGL